MQVSAQKLGVITLYLLKSEDLGTRLEGYETLEMLCGAYLEGEDVEAGKEFNRVWESLPRPQKKYFVNNVTAFKSCFNVVSTYQELAIN